MNIPIKITNGEKAVLDLLREQGEQGSNAHERLTTNGLPTRRVEAWHYTDLRNLLKDYPPVATADAQAAKLALSAIKDGFDGAQLPIIDGFYQQDLASALPAGLDLKLQLPSVVAEDIAADDAIALINSGLANEGLTLAIDDNAQLIEMVSIVHFATGNASSAVRHNVHIGAGAQATFIERHLNADGQASLTNTRCDLELGEGAVVTWLIDQRMSENATRFGQLNVRLGKNANLTILSLNSGCVLSRQEIKIKVSGEGSDLTIKGVNLIGDGAHIDVTTKLDHLVPDTVSNEIFRNVVVGGGRGVFQGQINVAQIAQRTDARMACNSLLMSDRSEFSAKPELEIFADDVQCAHGATVTDIDDGHLFYLMARGIPEKLSRDLLIKAFVEEVFEGLDNEQIGESLNSRIDDWLDKNA